MFFILSIQNRHHVVKGIDITPMSGKIDNG